MKHAPYTSIVLLLSVAFPAYAQVQMQAVELNAVATSSAETTATPEWTELSDSDPGVAGEGDPDNPVVVGTVQNAEDEDGDDSESTASQQGRVILDSDVNEQTDTTPGERINRPDFGGGMQGGEQVAPSQTPVIAAPSAAEETKESGEKAGTEDINIGVGELQETQRNESDLEFLRTRADVSVSAVEVRGWDPEKKDALLRDVKDHAEVRSGEDLENFATGVLLEHESIDSIETTATSVKLERRVPAKLFGIFDTRIEQETTVRFGDGEHGRVKVKFPWHRFLYKVDERYTQSGMDETLLPEIDDEVLTGLESGNASPSTHAGIIQRLLDMIGQ